jgi:diguanylate cyclase (GGDEF)-like protein
MVALLDSHVSDLTKQLQERYEESQRIKELANKLDEANRQLEELVVTDHLTGIGNRRFFSDRMSMKLAEAERGSPLALMMIDIDDFKPFNDIYGHQAGDAAIRTVADSISSVIRKVDCLARYGGEEFVLASSVTHDGAKVLADKLLNSVRSIGCYRRPLTVSIGIAEYRSGDSEHSILSRADIALYEAKRRGKDQAVFVEDSDRE